MGTGIPDPLFAARVKLEVERRLFGSDQRLQVGRFEVLDRLGAGAMSIVYAAHDPQLGRTVALKLLQDGVASERLIREARALARLRHPSVVSVYEVGTWQDLSFIALEHVEGVTLGAWLRAEPRPWREIVRVLADVAAGLAAVHDAGLVHRDVKPDNIVVDGDGAPRLVDFGLVSALDERDPQPGIATTPSAEALTRPGGTPGTPRYMAPERLRGEPTTPASDQFSFAVTLGEALEGREVPARIRLAVARGRSPIAEARFPTMAAMHDALRYEPSRRWVVPSTLLLVTGLALVVAAWPTPPRRAASACDQAAEIATRRWGPDQRAAVERALGSAGAPALRGLDDHAGRLADAQRDLCLAERRPTPPATAVVAELRACLDGQLAAFDDAVRALAAADPATLARATDLVAELPPIEECRLVDDSADAIAGGDPAIYVELAQGTASEDARSTMRTGLRALRDGDRNRAARSFEEAARLDGQYAAPHLWLALQMSHGELIAARAAFEKAFGLRAGLSPANRTLLSALVPCIQADPIDELACEAGLSRAAHASPRSAHLWFELARHQWNREGSSQAVIDAFDRALAADPGFVLPRFAKGQALAYLGRFDEALATVDECLRAVPGATACMHDRVWINAHRGDCDEVAADAQRWRAAAPTDTLAYAFLASTALARGDSLDSVAELLSQAAERAPESERAFFRTRDRVLLDIIAGDFAAARRNVDAMDATVAHLPDRASRMLAPRLRIMIALETGDRPEAARLAAETLRKQAAWTPDPRAEDFAIGRDFVPSLLDTLRDTGELTDSERAMQRGRWLDDWRARTVSFNHPFLWLSAYARNVDDEAEAAEAVAALEQYGRPPFHPLSYPEAGLGRMLLLSGRAADAIELLRRAAGACHAVEFTFGIEVGWQSVRASRDLGRALEQTGDRAGACAAYQAVLDRWGRARPRSVTADDARAARARLGCPDD